MVDSTTHAERSNVNGGRVGGESEPSRGDECTTSVTSMGQEPIEMTLVDAGPLRTHSYPAAVDVRWASTTHVRAAARAVESVSYE
jgi:hypothetical protein